jgi:hypothetical protein
MGQSRGHHCAAKLLARKSKKRLQNCTGRRKIKKELDMIVSASTCARPVASRPGPGSLQRRPLLTVTSLFALQTQPRFLDLVGKYIWFEGMNLA